MLIHNWREVLRYAWSIRFIVLAILFSAAEVAVPMLQGYVDVPHSLFASLAGLSSGLAFYFRIKAQKVFKDADQPPKVVKARKSGNRDYHCNVCRRIRRIVSGAASGPR